MFTARYGLGVCIKFGLALFFKWFIKHHAMLVYGGREVYIHAFVISAKAGGEGSVLHSPVLFTQVSLYRNGLLYRIAVAWFIHLSCSLCVCSQHLNGVKTSQNAD